MAELPPAGNRLLIRMIAAASAAEALLQAGSAALFRDAGQTALWILGATGIFSLGFVIENHKRLGAE